MTKKQTTILAIVGTAVLLCVVVLAAALMFIRSTIHRQETDDQTAAATMNAAREKFNGAIPVIELRPGGPVYTRPVPDGPAAPLHRVHVLAWDPDDQSLARMDMPFALLRWKDAPFTVASGVADTFSLDRAVSIKASDLERFGPALLLDQDMPDGTHTLIWTD